MPNFSDLKPYFYKAFLTESQNSGNPAAIMHTQHEDASTLQALASNLNFPVVVFILPPADQNSLPNNTFIRIRFFYPHRETNICVHGALAACYHLLNAEKLSSITLMRRDNIAVNLSKEKDQYFVNLNPAETFNKSFDAEAVLKMLNINESALDLSLPFKNRIQVGGNVSPC